GLPPSVSLGAHTVNHPDLRRLDDPDIIREVLDSRSEIQQKTGRPVNTFAYPYGASDNRTAAVVRREFAVGCGTRLDFAEPVADAAVLPRLDTYYLKSAEWFRHLFGFRTRLYVGFRRLARESREAGYTW